MSDILVDLNAAQREAVTAPDGPVLVVAGAGSGKTRVLTSRVAWLLAEQRARKDQIIAFTFTNRAAKEMRERIANAVPAGGAPSWIGTFHATGLKMLRMRAADAGLQRDFTIYDTDDSQRLVKQVMGDLDIDPKQTTPGSLRHVISRWKNDDVPVAEARKQADSVVLELAARVYEGYEKGLRDCNALDFDDLLLRTVHLLEGNEEIRAHFADRFRHVLVDEFQDTNALQMILIKLLTSAGAGVFAVGDDDQAIYSWRGARVENMLDFEEFFAGTRLLRLEQNYRSTGNILAAANEVIVHNKRRKGKNLWTEEAAGDRLQVHDAADAEDEAARVVDLVREELDRGRRRGDITVLYRTNAQSRLLEAALGRAAIPHQVVGSLQFYQRREVRDLMAYLKLVANPRDRVSALRVINVPRRKIGDTTSGRLVEIAEREGLSLGEAAARPELGGGAVGPAACRRVREFFQLVAAWRAAEPETGVPALLERIVRETGYLGFLERSDSESARDRATNVDELINAAYAYAEASDGGRLSGFLEQVALVADSDALDTTEGAVRLMTVHTAKGLEFPVVLITGCEEGLLPHATSLEEEHGTEEERRLFYVALTRARRRAHLLHAHRRRRFGVYEDSLPSRFLGEIPDELIDRHLDALPETSSVAGSGLFGVGGGGRSGRSGAAGRSSLFPAPAPGRASSKATRPVRAPSPAAVWQDDVSQVEIGYRPGQLVRHGTYGSGVVVRVEGSGDDLLVTVDFDGGERKHLLPRFAPLIPLD